MLEHTKKIARSHIWELAAFLIGVAAALVTTSVSKDLPDSLIFGALVTIAMTLIRDLWEHKSRNMLTHGTLQSLMGAISLRERSLTKELTLLRWSVKDLDPSEMREVWRDLLWLFEEEYCATNHSLAFSEYSGAKTFYHENFVKFAHPLQALKIQRGAKVRRILIVNSPAELVSHMETIAQQTSAEMSVRYVFWQRMEKDNALNHVSCGLASEDFGIFDKSCVLIWNNDQNNRSVIGGRLIYEKSQVSAYRKYYERLFEASEKINSVVLEPLTDANRAAIMQWNDYPREFSEYTYAIRDGGWLDTIALEPNSTSYAAYSGNRLVGFTLLAGETDDCAELYIAISPGWLYNGFGAAAILRTLEKAFEHKKLNRIRLKVRVTNKIAEKIYRTLGFTQDPSDSQGTEIINGSRVRLNFFSMSRTSYDSSAIVNPGHR